VVLPPLTMASSSPILLPLGRLPVLREHGITEPPLLPHLTASETVVLWVMFGLGVGISLLALLGLAITLYRRHRHGLSLHPKAMKTRGIIGFTIQVMLPWPPLLRAFQYLFAYLTDVSPFMAQVPSPMGFLDNFFAGMPYYLYDAIFCLLLFFWLKIRHGRAVSMHETTRLIFLEWGIAVGTIFLGWAILLMCNASLPNRLAAVFEATAAFAVVINSSLMAGFSYIAIILLPRLRSASSSRYSLIVTLKMVCMNLLCSALYILHVVIIITDVWILNTDLLYSSVSVFVFNLVAEFFPVILLLIIIHFPKIRKPSHVRHLYGSTNSSMDYSSLPHTVLAPASSSFVIEDGFSDWSDDDDSAGDDSSELEET
jgi:hypothetical protein